MSTPRAFFTATLLDDAKVLIAGGQANVLYMNENAGTASTEIYDPSTGRFSAAAPMSIGRAGHTATLLPNGDVLVAGGYTKIFTMALNLAEIFSPATNSWKPASPMRYGRARHAAVLMADGRVLVIGGSTTGPDPSADGSSVSRPATVPPEIYDPKTDTWSTAATPQFDRPVDPTATLLKDGRLLVVGGQNLWNSPDETRENSELYDPKANRWSATSPEVRTGAREEHSATLLPDGRVLIAGGEREGQPTASAAIYDPVADSWTQLGNMNESRCGQAAVLLPGEKVLMIGSGCRFGQAKASAEELDLPTNRWRAVASMANPRGMAVAVALRDGSVIALGGAFLPQDPRSGAYPSQAIASAELFVTQ